MSHVEIGLQVGTRNFGPVDGVTKIDDCHEKKVGAEAPTISRSHNDPVGAVAHQHGVGPC